MYSKRVTVDFVFESDTPFEMDDSCLVEHVNNCLESDVVTSQMDLLVQGTQSDNWWFEVQPEVNEVNTDEDADWGEV